MNSYLFILGVVLASLASSIASLSENSSCSLTANGKRIFVLSDITNEPDDTMSFIRMLTHSDMYTIEGMVAVTSWWLNDTTAPDAMKTLINRYETVRPTLQTHTDGYFPSANYLLPIVKSGPKLYGTYALEALENGGQISEGAELLINATDSSNERLFVMAWGGVNTLAEALWHLQRTRSAEELDNFTSKLSLYTISDQDDTGFWIRSNFPNLRYVASIHGFNQYGDATWLGMSSADVNGSNAQVVSDVWLAENIQIGPLGELYPDVAFVMEGDSPSLLFTFQNGLNVPEHPEYGGWGGRYTPVSMGKQLFANALDSVVGMDGKTYKDVQATVWRWREIYQNEFASRIQWTMRANGRNSSTSHPPIVHVNGTCGTLPYEVNVRPNSTVTFDATGTYDQDTGSADSLNITWFKYTDVTFSTNNMVAVWNLTVPDVNNGMLAQVSIPSESESCLNVKGGGAESQLVCQVFHLILQVTGSGPGGFPMTRYRRTIMQVKP